jgi:putative heme-binding domain-containing protein
LRLAGCLLLAAAIASAQRDRSGNPLAGNAEAIAQGEKFYGVRCAVCHGKDARGGGGPSLHKSRVVIQAPDRRFFDIVKNGVPGGEMPPLAAPDGEIWRIITYVHSLTKPGQGPPVPGDPAQGRRVFANAGCSRCHIAEGQGGVLGPDLRSVALQLTGPQIRDAVLAPENSIAEGFRRIALTTRDGRRIEGTLKNEDNFSVQLMAQDGELMTFARHQVAQTRVEKRSWMPADFGQRLSPDDLQNLLSFLDRQRAPFRQFTVSFQNY